MLSRLTQVSVIIRREKKARKLCRTMWLIQAIGVVCCMDTERHKGQVGKQHMAPWCASALML